MINVYPRLKSFNDDIAVKNDGGKLCRSEISSSLTYILIRLVSYLESKPSSIKLQMNVGMNEE